MNTPSTAAFTVDEVLKASWAGTKKNWQQYLMLIGSAILFYIGFAIVFGFLSRILGLPMLIENILSNLVGIYVSLFMAKGALAVGRGQKFELMELAKIDAKMFLQALLASILFYLVVVIGLVLLIVPGIIAGLMFCFYTYSIVDQNTDAIQSLEDSMHLTEGNKLKIFLFNLLLGLIGVVAVAIPALILFVIASARFGSERGMGLVLVIGILFVIAMAIVAVILGMVGMSGQAYMYLKMRAKTPLHIKK